MSASDIKSVESNIKRLLERYILADASDLRTVSGENPYPLCETYENYIREHAGKEKKSTYVNLHVEARHFVVAAFMTMMNELNEIADPSDLMAVSVIMPAGIDDTMRAVSANSSKSAMEAARLRLVNLERTRFIVGEVVKSNDQSITQFMFDMVCHHELDRDGVLAKDSDPQKYFKGKTELLLGKYRLNDSLIALVYGLFDSFLKILARSVSRFLWFRHEMVSRDTIKGLLFSHGMTYDLVQKLDYMATETRSKVAKPAKKKAESKPADAAVVTADAVVVTADAAAVVTADAAVVTANAAVVTADAAAPENAKPIVAENTPVVVDTPKSVSAGNTTL